MKNAMAATSVAKLMQIRNATIRESLSNFQGVEHRLEKVLKIQNVQYINDSKATNVNATFFALDSMNTPTVWIVGGVDKGNDYNELMSMVREKVKAIICLGVDNRKIIDVFGNVVDIMVEVTNMRLDGTLRFKSVKTLIEQLPRLTNNKFFTQPSVGDMTVVYRSKRFCIVEIKNDEMFEFYDKSMCDYVFWDGKYGAVSATINTNVDGTLTVTAVTQWGDKMTFKTMKELALRTPMFVHRAFNEQDRGTY